MQLVVINKLLRSRGLMPVKYSQYFDASITQLIFTVKYRNIIFNHKIWDIFQRVPAIRRPRD